MTLIDTEIEEQDVGSMLKPMPLALPANVIKDIFSYISGPQLYQIMIKSHALSPLAEAALYGYLILEKGSRVDKFMECRPKPEEIAGYIETLEIPGALVSPAKDYIERLIALSPNLYRLKVGLPYSTDPDVGYFPLIPPRIAERIRILTVGPQTKEPVSSDSPFIPMSVLKPFKYLRELHWDPVDPRLPPLHDFLDGICQFCPYIKELSVPWTGKCDPARLPDLGGLKKLTFRFEHNSRIDLALFISCLRVFYKHQIPVQIGTACSMETALWLQDFYSAVWCQETQYHHPPEELLSWIIDQNRRCHLLRFSDDRRDRSMRESMFRAIERVDWSRGLGSRIQISLTRDDNPRILYLGNSRYFRLQINRENIDPGRMPNLLRANPRLKSLVLAMHIANYGPSYLGNCTFNKIPLLPGYTSRFTKPPFELVYKVDKHPETGKITQRWRWYSSRYLQHEIHEVERLQELNVLNQKDYDEAGWTPALVKRLEDWEAEVKGWFGICLGLTAIAIILNTDTTKFGSIQDYWCTCR